MNDPPPPTHSEVNRSSDAGDCFVSIINAPIRAERSVNSVNGKAIKYATFGRRARSGRLPNVKLA
jgi:hypothetical protein